MTLVLIWPHVLMPAWTGPAVTRLGMLVPRTLPNCKDSLACGSCIFLVAVEELD